MKAIRIYQFGGPEVLQLDDVPLPEPGLGQARIKIEYSGVNFADVYFRSGEQGGKLPDGIGGEGAGIVDAVGPDVTSIAPGDRVAYATQRGSYAEYAIVQAGRLVRIPDGVTTKLAAAVMLQGMTAQYLSHTTFPIHPGDVALVHAAAGGVGLLLVQMIKQRGGRVIGTVSTREKADLARLAGADDIILYTEQDFEKETRRLTADRGVNVVYDSVGKTTFAKGLDCLVKRGMMVLFGHSSGRVDPLDPMVLNAKGSLFLTRPSLVGYTLDRTELLERANSVLGMVAQDQLRVRIDRVFPLAQAADAQRYLESRASKGKILIQA